MGQVNVPELEGGELLAEKADRREFIDLLKRMLTMDQERRISPGEALQHSFVTLQHLLDYPHCSNVKASMQVSRDTVECQPSKLVPLKLLNIGIPNRLPITIQTVKSLNP